MYCSIEDLEFALEKIKEFRKNNNRRGYEDYRIYKHRTGELEILRFENDIPMGKVYLKEYYGNDGWRCFDTVDAYSDRDKYEVMRLNHFTFGEMFKMDELQKSDKPLSAGTIIIGTLKTDIEMIIPEPETIVIPVTIGGQQIDSIIAKLDARSKLRNGGR